jgi:subtilase family serine protease
MFARVHSSLPWTATLLVAVLSIALWSPRTAAGGPLPDVVVSGLTLTPATVRAGDPVMATVTLRNQGSGPADASLVGLYLGTSSGSPLTSALPLGTLAVEGLVPGASQQVSSSFTVPAVAPGSFSVIAVADGAATLVENNETNNRRSAGLRVTIADLTLSRVTLAPSHARTGDTVTATVVIYNAGRVPANASTVRLHFETASGVPPSVVGSGLAGTLAAGQSGEVSFAFTVPSVPPRHSYYVWAQADADGSLLETNEGNNRRGAWLDVTIPDLTITSLSVRPAPARAGDPVTATVVARNSGQVPTDASSLRLYFETASGTPPSPATLLGTATVGALKPGEFLGLSLPFTVPAVPYGRSYYVWAQVDPDGSLLETNEGNNRRGAWLKVAVPDLSVEGLSMTPNPARAGDAITVSLRVRNRGPVPANASQASLSVTTSSSATLAGINPLTTADVPLLAPGKEASLVFPVTLPILSPGQYQLIAVADSAGAQTESTKTNNRRAAGFEVAVPVVTLDALGLAPSVVQAGQTATASVRISNRGRAWSRPTTADVFLATSDTAELSGGTSAQTIAISSLKPGASVSLPVPVTIPVVDPGAYYVVAQVDASTAGGGGTMLVASTSSTGPSPSRPRKSVKLRVSMPDLTVSTLSLNPNQGPTGTTVTVTLTVQNAGTAASAATSLAFCLASPADASLSGGAALKTLGVPSLQAGTSIGVTATLTIPAVEGGTYQLLAVLDPDGAVAESIETNNRAATPLTIEDSDSTETWAGNPYGILVSGMDHTTPRSEVAIFMQKAKDAGARWVRSDFWWYSVEWFRGQWNWRYFDIVVEEAAARGLKVIPILQGTPAWAATDGVFAYGVPDMDAWETFVMKTVERYRGRIAVWEIWNEPDGPWYWKGTPAKYAELLARAHGAIKSLDPTAMVWLGGLAQGGTNVTADFLQRILADASHPAGEHFDVHNIHTNFRNMTGINNQIEANRAILGSFGLQKPLVVTEASYTSDPRFQWLAGYGGGEQGLARYIVDAYRTMLDAGVLVAVWANITDYDGNDEYAGSGLVRTDLSEKAAFFAFQELAESAP